MPALCPAQGTDAAIPHLPPPDLNSLDAQLRAQLSPHARVYAQACALSDHETAIVALNYLLLEQPENRFLQDSLVALYRRAGKQEACRLWCAQLLQQRPDDRYLLGLSSELAQEQGDLAGALTHAERIWRLEGSHYWRYQVASLQFQLGRHGECAANLASMLTDSTIDNESLRILWDGGGSEVPMRAALLNLRGNLEIALGKESFAQKSFRQALKICPEFQLARNNLSAIQDKHRQDWESRGGGN